MQAEDRSAPKRGGVNGDDIHIGGSTGPLQPNERDNPQDVGVADGVAGGDVSCADLDSPSPTQRSVTIGVLAESGDCPDATIAPLPPDEAEECLDAQACCMEA